MKKPPSDPIRLRRLLLTDYDSVKCLFNKCRPGESSWLREQFSEQVQIFPQGQLGIECGGRLIAASSTLLVKYNHYQSWHDWRLVSDSGFIRNHDPKGDVLCCIELLVDPEFVELNLERRIYNARKKLARSLNTKFITIAGPTPNYKSHASKMREHEYMKLVLKKRLEDARLRVQYSCGFSIKSVEQSTQDSASEPQPVWLEWLNTDYQEPRDSFLVEPTQVRICVVQYKMRRISSFEEFAMQCEFFVDTAAGYKTDFVLFPELFTTQLLSLVGKVESQVAARRLAEFTPRFIEMFKALALRYDVNIIGGSQFVLENDNVFNVSHLFRRNGTIAEQYKIHITPSEKRWWGVSAGNKVEVMETDRGRIAIAICYDIEFPELVRVAASKGANIIFVPFNTDERYGYLRVKNCAMARAIENQLYVAIAGCTGNLPMVENTGIHYAQSGIFTPCDFPFARDGVASESNPNTETVIVHDVELDLLRKVRLKGTTQNWNDRRTDLFKVSYLEGADQKIIS